MDVRQSVLLGTGEGTLYTDILERLSEKSGKETVLFRSMCEDEYNSIVQNNNQFIPYDWAMEKKWFAICYEHAQQWGDRFYPDNRYKIVEITVLEESLKYMFYLP